MTNISDIVKAYRKRKEPVISEGDRKKYEEEFEGRYVKTIGTIEGQLIEDIVEDIEELVSSLISEYEGQLAPVQIKKAVSSPLYDMKLELRETYVKMRVQGEQSEEAFESAVRPMGSLIKVVEAENTQSDARFLPFFSRIRKYLEGAKEAGGAGVVYKKDL